MHLLGPFCDTAVWSAGEHHGGRRGLGFLSIRVAPYLALAPVNLQIDLHGTGPLEMHAFSFMLIPKNLEIQEV